MSEERAWSPFLAMAVITAVIVGIPWGLKIATAPEIGEACGGGFDCAPLDGRCVAGEHGRYCTVLCEQDADCPSNGHCGIPPHDDWRRWFASSPLSDRVCIPGPKPDEAPTLDDLRMPEGDPGVQYRPPGPRGE